MMKLRRRNSSAKPSLVSPEVNTKKVKPKKKKKAERKASSLNADEFLTAILEKDNGVKEMKDSSTSIIENPKVEDEINLLLELCMADEGTLGVCKDENSDPNVMPNPNFGKADESLEALMDIQLGELGEIASPSSFEVTGMMLDHEGMVNDAPALEVHAHSAFSEYHPGDKTMAWEYTSQRAEPPPAPRPCARCLFWINRTEQLKSHFICQLKQYLDDSESEYYMWNSDGRSFTITDHPETESMLMELLQPNTLQKVLPTFRRKIYAYGFKKLDKKSKNSYCHPWFRRESTPEDLLWIVEVQKSKNGGGRSLHRGCHFARRDLHAVPAEVDSSSPFSAPMDDPDLDHLIAEILSEVFLDQQDESSSSSLHTATTMKLENAKKLGVLSLTEHGLDALPSQMLELAKLRTLDLSKNALTTLAGIERFLELKTLKCDYNELTSVRQVSSLAKLQTLSLSHNQLGKPTSELPSSWPASLKQLSLAANVLSNIPQTIMSPRLSKLVSLDLSSNNLAILPEEIRHLCALEELNLDDNTIVGLSHTVGDLKKLKILSLRNNQLSVTSTLFNNSSNPQPLPAVLFTDTALIDLNLHGNRMTNTQLNEFEGFQTFLDRRQKVKSKTLTNLDVCGLK